MGLADAQTAQGMATRHRRSVKAVVAGVGEINALLAKMIKGGKIKWNGYGTYCEWYVRKLKETSSWVSGQLGSRSFEEKNPMDKAELPYCFLDETYGVSEKSMKTNRAAGAEKLYDIQKENARNAQTALYRAIVDAIYSNGTNALVPVGLPGICADPLETTGNVTTVGSASYAGITQTAAAITAWSSAYGTMGWSNEYWKPTIIDSEEVPTGDGTILWTDDCLTHLVWMQHAMSRTADISGTGKIIKPDLALMGTDPWASLIAKLLRSQSGTAGVAVGTTDPHLGNFTTVRVGSLDCVFDENVPDDSGSVERVFVLDSKAFYIDTLNTKSEGLVEGDWKMDDPEVVGGVGMYKSNLALVCETPQAVGCITGCDG